MNYEIFSIGDEAQEFPGGPVAVIMALNDEQALLEFPSGERRWVSKEVLCPAGMTAEAS